MTYKRDVFTSKEWRRRQRRNATFLAGFNATTNFYSGLRKRQYVAAWLDGLAARRLFDADPGFFNVRAAP